MLTQDPNLAYQPNADRYTRMAYPRCGASGVRLPALSLGLWQNFGGADSLTNARAMVQCAFDLGITQFDLANNYGPPYGSDRKSTRLNSSHVAISYAVFCLKKKNIKRNVSM